jgi:putrescine transport system permease protein
VEPRGERAGGTLQGAGRTGRGGRLLVGGTPFFWLTVFFLAPFLIVLKISLSERVNARPPYAPIFSAEDGPAAWLDKIGAFSLDNFRMILDEPLYWDAFLTSLRLAGLSTLLILLVGYPIAYGMARAPSHVRRVLVTLAILPFWTSFLIRVYAWIGILKPEGLLNSALLRLGAISEPLEIMNTDTAVLIGLVYSYLPFMVLPLYAALERMDETLLEAAQDLGCPPWKAFWLVTLPLSLPGVLAGSFLVFIPALGEFVIPDLLGGSDTLMIGRTLWTEFFGNRDWPLASAVALVLLVIIVGPVLLYRHTEAGRVEGAR